MLVFLIVIILVSSMLRRLFWMPMGGFYHRPFGWYGGYHRPPFDRGPHGPMGGPGRMGGGPRR